MDGRQFDSVARALGVASTRRSAIAGLVAAVVPFAAEGKRRDTRKRKQKRKDGDKGNGKLGAAGPCGNGGPKANQCEKDRDCCTGVCDKNAGKKYGRCRCRQRGQSCTADSNCCNRGGQSLVCQDGTCQKGTCAPNCICEPECDQGRYCDPNLGSCCSAIDGPCSSPSDCCFNGNNDPDACSNQGECNFCNGDGAACTFAGTCCSEMCVDGECACYALQEPCSNVRQCCGYLSNSVSCEAGRCCLDFFEECTSDEECCDGACVNFICNA